MFNTALHRQITKQYKNIEQDAIANEKKNGTYSSIETPMPVNNSFLIILKVLVLTFEYMELLMPKKPTHNQILQTRW